MEKGADSPTLRFYRNIYTNIYPYNRGVLVFYVNPYDFFDSFYAQVQCPFYFSASDGSYIGYNNGVFIRYDEKPQALTDASSKIQELRFPDGCPVMEIPILPLDTVKARSQFLPPALVVPLILFTVFYFLMNLSINRRLGGFTRHLQNASAEELMPFETPPYQDEIGIAIEAYNNMLARTNSLIHENLKVRIQKQNSDYYALPGPDQATLSVQHSGKHPNECRSSQRFFHCGHASPSWTAHALQFKHELASSPSGRRTVCSPELSADPRDPYERQNKL